MNYFKKLKVGRISHIIKVILACANSRAHLVWLTKEYEGFGDQNPFQDSSFLSLFVYAVQ